MCSRFIRPTIHTYCGWNREKGQEFWFTLNAMATFLCARNASSMITKAILRDSYWCFIKNIQYVLITSKNFIFLCCNYTFSFTIFITHYSIMIVSAMQLIRINVHTEKRYVENNIQSDCICSDKKSLLKSTY